MYPQYGTEKVFERTFSYVPSIETKEFMFKLLKSRKIDAKCNKTYLLLLNATGILFSLPLEENQAITTKP